MVLHGISNYLIHSRSGDRPFAAFHSLGTKSPRWDAKVALGQDKQLKWPFKIMHVFCWSCPSAILAWKAAKGLLCWNRPVPAFTWLQKCMGIVHCWHGKHTTSISLKAELSDLYWKKKTAHYLTQGLLFYQTILYTYHEHKVNLEITLLLWLSVFIFNHLY